MGVELCPRTWSGATPRTHLCSLERALMDEMAKVELWTSSMRAMLADWSARAEQPSVPS